MSEERERSFSPQPTRSLGKLSQRDPTTLLYLKGPASKEKGGRGGEGNGMRNVKEERGKGTKTREEMGNWEGKGKQS